jgi:hypothetical protein
MTAEPYDMPRMFYDFPHLVLFLKHTLKYDATYGIHNFSS